jgi:uncharacterized protein YggE
MTKVPGELNVSGEGQVTVNPDVAWVRLGVVTEAKTAGEAAAQNSALANQVVERILALGIARESLRTTGLTIAPMYEYPEGAAPRIVGYRVEDSITIECAVTLAAKVFDGGVAAGANESSGLSFGIKDEAPHRRRALEAAVQSARTDAETVAAAMGVHLLGAKLIEVDAGGVPVLFKTARAERGPSDTPVLPGELTVSARVRVVFVY